MGSDVRWAKIKRAKFKKKVSRVQDRSDGGQIRIGLRGAVLTIERKSSRGRTSEKKRARRQGCKAAGRSNQKGEAGRRIVVDSTTE